MSVDIKTAAFTASADVTSIIENKIIYSWCDTGSLRKKTDFWRQRCILVDGVFSEVYIAFITKFVIWRKKSF